MQEAFADTLVLTPPLDTKPSHLSPSALTAIQEISGRELWKSRPDGFGLYIGLFNDGEIPQGIVFDTKTLKPTRVFHMDEPQTASKKFSTVIISINSDAVSMQQVSDLVEQTETHLRRNIGDASEEKQAKSGAIFVISPFSNRNKETLTAMFDLSDVLVKTNVLEQNHGQEKRLIAEGRAERKSKHQEINLIERSENSEFDYIKAMKERVVANYKGLDLRIKRIDFSPIDERLMHSRNHLKNVTDLKYGLDVKLEFNCGCVVHKNRDASNEYLEHCSDGEHISIVSMPTEKNEIKPTDKKEQTVNKYIGPTCGDCGGEMVWAPKKAKGGRWDCPIHPA